MPRKNVHSEAYDYLQRLPRSGWAWEFLRRNAAYREAHLRHREGRLKRRIAPGGALVLTLERAEPEAALWGLQFFASPERTGLAAPIFWTPAAFRKALKARAVDAGEGGFFFDLMTLCCARVHLTDAGGGEHLILAGAGRAVQIACSGRSLLSGAVRLQFEIDGVDDIGSKTATLRAFARLYKAAAPERAAGGWTPPSARLRDQLIAFDARAAGGSYRDICRAVFGARRTDAEYGAPDRALKNQAVRLVKRANAMVAGGYRKLLE